MTARPGQDLRTRQQVLAIVLDQGPISASGIARMVDLTPAAVRRHLDALEKGNAIEVRELAGVKAGRGRPARHYVVTSAGHAQISHSYDQVAIEALDFVSSELGREAVERFARTRAQELKEKLEARVEEGGSVSTRSRALAAALDKEGYAASATPVAVGTPLEAMQLCQGHCPIQHVAEEYPEFCEAELEQFGEILGVDVRRLSTLASGAHVCTTHIPTSTLNRPLLGSQDGKSNPKKGGER